MKILALDLGKYKSVFCEFDSQNGTQEYGKVATRPQAVHDLFVERQPNRVVIEIGSAAGWVYDMARGLGFEAEVANTNHEIWKWHRTQNKNDRNDALRLAKLSWLGELPTVHMPSKSVRQMRSLIAYRQSLVQRRTQIKNSIRALLEREGLRLPPSRKGWTQEALAQLRAWSRPWSQVEAEQLWRGQLAMELELLASTEDALQEVTAKLDALAKANESVQRLQSAAGIGPRLAEAVVAVLDDPHRFANRKQVGNYVGLTPRQYQSGQMERQGRISRKGNTLLRSLLVEVSWMMLRWNDWARETYARLLRGSPGRKKIAITAVARQLLVRCWAMLRDGTRWREPEVFG
jgi:transposase